MPEVEAWARWAAEKASLTKISPSDATAVDEALDFSDSLAKNPCVAQ